MKVIDTLSRNGNLLKREVINSDDAPNMKPLISYYAEQIKRGEIEDENNKN
jgi:hypothetical protein